VYSIQHYVIKFVSDLRQVGWFSPGTPVTSTNKTYLHDKTDILLKVALSTINQTKPTCLSIHGLGLCLSILGLGLCLSILGLGLCLSILGLGLCLSMLGLGHCLSILGLT
jgi:hypothetical protein